MTNLQRRFDSLARFLVLAWGTASPPGALAQSSVSTPAPVPVPVGTGAAVAASDDFIYLVPGGGSDSFYCYSIWEDLWTSLKKAPGPVDSGAAMTYASASGKVYLLVGGYSSAFHRFNVASGNWDPP